MDHLRICPTAATNPELIRKLSVLCRLTDKNERCLFHEHTFLPLLIGRNLEHWLSPGVCRELPYTLHMQQESGTAAKKKKISLSAAAFTAQKLWKSLGLTSKHTQNITANLCQLAAQAVTDPVWLYHLHPHHFCFLLFPAAQIQVQMSSWQFLAASVGVYF